MSIVTIRKNIKKYLERHGVELICSLAMLDSNMDSFGSYLENYLCAKGRA